MFRRRIVYSENAFAELILWRVQKPIAGSQHSFKYRLAYVVNEVCVLRFDNETGKGDHRYVGNKESPYVFTTPEKLIANFQREIARWDHESGHT